MLNFLAETFLLGLKNLRLHKLRSLLTALGIILGVAAVIVMVAYGEGVKQNAMDDIQHLGPKNILVQSKKPPESNQASNRTQRVLEYGLKRADLDRLQTLLATERSPRGLMRIVPLRDTEQRVVLGDIRANANAIGTTPDVFSVINLRLARGHFFDRVQYDRSEAVCVIGYFGEGKTTDLLIWSQVILSMQLSFAVIPLLIFTNSRKKMGRFANPAWLKWTAWGVSAVIIVLNVKLIFDWITGA